MEELEKVKLSDATDYLIEELMNNYNLNKTTARNLLANILLRNLVIEEIKSMADYITGREDKE
jgi:hypothetical protein